jgi:hypothetical protein
LTGPAILLIVFGAIWLNDGSKGGYKAVNILDRLEGEFGGDGYRGDQGAVDRALIGEESVHALSSLAVGFLRLQSQADVDAADDEHAAIEFDLARSLRDQAAASGLNLTRFQRASEGSGESTGGSGDDVIQCGGVLLEHARRQLIVFRDGAVNAEDHRLALDGEIRTAHGPVHALDPNARAVDNVSHGSPPGHCSNNSTRPRPPLSTTM